MCSRQPGAARREGFGEGDERNDEIFERKQQRMHRTPATPARMADEAPAHMVLVDLLYIEGVRLRARS